MYRPFPSVLSLPRVTMLSDAADCVSFSDKAVDDTQQWVSLRYLIDSWFLLIILFQNPPSFASLLLVPPLHPSFLPIIPLLFSCHVYSVFLPVYNHPLGLLSPTLMVPLYFHDQRVGTLHHTNIKIKNLGSTYKREYSICLSEFDVLHLSE